VIIVMTLLARDEVDIVAATVEHHLAAGVDLIIATDNGSVDGTVDVLSAYQNAGVLELHHEPIHEFRQAEWVTRMARRAATEFHADWVINADADEFLWPPDELRPCLAAADSTCLRVQRDNLVAYPGIEGAWPARLILRDPLSLSPRGKRIGPKVIHAADSEVTVAPGNHAVAAPSITASSDRHRLRMLHAPERSFAQYLRKIENGVTACQANAELAPEVCWHWREALQQMRAGTLADRLLAADDVAAQLRSGRLVRDTRLRDRLGMLAGSAVLPTEIDKVLRV
jgi:hypothetical protein